MLGCHLQKEGDITIPSLKFLLPFAVALSLLTMHAGAQSAQDSRPVSWLSNAVSFCTA
jgi:hypothetical protein